MMNLQNIHTAEQMAELVESNSNYTMTFGSDGFRLYAKINGYPDWQNVLLFISDERAPILAMEGLKRLVGSHV